MNSDYCIKIDYQKGTENPERVFDTMSGLILAFKEFDRNLARIISVDLKPTIILEEITTGSLKTRIASILKEIDDAALKELNWKKLAGRFLVKGKYKLIEFLENKKTIESLDEIDQFNEELLALAREVDILYLPSYSPIPGILLLENIKKVSEAVSPLMTGDLATIIAEQGEISINKQFNLPTEKIETLLTEQIVKSRREIVLKVKKPDFLGKSKWEMKIGSKAIPVKIERSEERRVGKECRL